MTRDRGCLAAIAISVLVVVAPLSVLIGTVVVNNVRMNDWKSSLFDAPIPAGARLVDRGTAYGLLRGNGNHCDRRAWLLLRTSHAASEIEAHFDRVSRQDSDARRVGPDRVLVEIFESGDNAGLDLRCH